MSLIIKNTEALSNYNLKTTHTGTPYLVVNKTQFLDLTTKTTLDTHIEINYNGTIYRPINTFISTASTTGSKVATTGYSGYSTRGSTYTVTTGYTGSSSRGSTSGYSGYSSRASTSGYKGSLSRASTSGYSGRSTYNLTRSSHYGYSGYTTWYQSGESTYWMIEYFTAQLKAKYPSSGVKTISYSCQASTTASVTSAATCNATCKVTWSGSGSIKDGKATWSTTKTDGQMTKSFHKISVNGGAYANYSFLVSVRGFYGTAKVSCQNTTLSGWWSKAFKGLTYTHTHTGRHRTSTTTASGKGAVTSGAVGALLSTTMLTRSSQYSASSYRTSGAVGALLSVTALTRSSAYTVTSSVVGALSGAAALTRSSSYNTTSGAVGNMSNTTALTRSSAYASSSTAVGNLSNTTALTKTQSKTSNYLTSATSIASETEVITSWNSTTGIVGYSGISTRVSTRGYSGTSSRGSTSGYSGSLSRKSTYGYTGYSTYVASRASTYGYSGYTTWYNSGTYLAHWVVKTRTGKLNAQTVTTKKTQVVTFTCNQSGEYATATSNTTRVASLTFSLSGTETYSVGGSYSGTKTDNGIVTTYFKSIRGKNAYNGYGWNYTAQGYQMTARLSNVSTTNSAWWKHIKAATITHCDTGYSVSSSSSQSGRNALTSAAVGALLSATALTKASNYNTQSLRSSNAVGVLLSTTALTQASRYGASSTAVGALSSTTALTRASNYATSSTAIGKMSSTTALTSASRYGLTAANSAGMSNVTTLTSITSSSVLKTITDMLSSITALTKTIQTISSKTILTEG